MKFYNHSFTFAKNANLPSESDVIGGLSYTPAEMASMSSRGAAVSLDTLSSQASYDSDQSFNVPFELIRGVDVNDAWEQERNSSRRVQKFRDGVQGKMLNLNNAKS